MKRNVSLEEITDGKLYGINDLVRVGNNGCRGCHSCCRDSADTIKLDPWDVCTLTNGLNKSFEKLMGEGLVELNVVDGLVLPNLKLDKDKGCSFLNEEGRCSIHSIRPGFCRLFPLGRYYHDDTFSYILQIHECPRCDVKVKVSKWLDTPDCLKREEFAGKWHYYIKKLSEEATACAGSEKSRNISMKVLTKFYLTPFCKDTFYDAVYERMAENDA